MKEYVEQIEETEKTVQGTDVLTDFVGVTYDGSPAILIRGTRTEWVWANLDASGSCFTPKSYGAVKSAVKQVIQDSCVNIDMHIYVFDTKKEQFEWALNHM